jgi:hypothetical protein
VDEETQAEVTAGVPEPIRVMDDPMQILLGPLIEGRSERKDTVAVHPVEFL